MKERDCANCKHHTSNGCSSWDCEFESTDLISRADAKQQISEWATIITKPTLLDKDATMVVLDLLPSTEAVQGEWVCKEREYNDCDGHYAHYWYECSVCGARPPKDTWKNEWHSNFCPSCGAKMSNK